MSINFPLLLVIAVLVSGLLALSDLLYFAPRRRAAIASYQGRTDQVDAQALEALNREPVLIEYGKSFFPVLAIVLVLRSFLVEPFQIPSGSMKPTLEVGDFILVNKFAYGIRLPVIDTKIIEVGDPKRGDVMVFRYPSDPNINYIKRVVGLPGDVIRYSSDRRLYVNDKLVAETLIGEEPGSLGSAVLYREQLGDVEHIIRKEMGRYRIEPSRQWTVPQGHYFMMGDNRDNSNDSRYWQDDTIAPELVGMVPDRNIVGKAFAVWMSWPDPKLSNLPHFSRVGLIH
ncbi:signal peptidase I [Pseudomonas sp. S5(2021)]|jgi:signal peptidase I|uniref:Signal peptidase I n=2 Tax=Stutzerimonas balearica TaxID=74829 RepID=A0A8D3Y309_9GAMM|nr:signal peptidase I [Stutzerimonas balearica]KIL06435.1 signal peptidase [Stutzerimonas stutzeri]MBB62423.1 signal peptidase I [Pseudomonas sp.]MBZ5757708.1 signal peptidase I [Pseudomonas sp. S5(2021)]WIX01886.1 signal peptidase I [Pseudomonas sp. AR5]AJE16323.1 signal peptidase [Stutzerimonas balearica DSM 6083]|tara:strand:+ start:613 stop:1467 length:855 start_codon:yes stop_codon:yes gene_type:complete